MLLFLVPLMAFLALSIDVGLLAIARTQCQDAADLAALAGVRTLNGNAASNNNYAAVAPAAQQAASANKVLWTAVQSSQVAVNIGRYTYNSATQQFEGQLPGASGNWSLVQAIATANVSGSMVFSRVLGMAVPSMQTKATAVHRPRDVALILDYSGSMKNGSYPGGAPLGTSNWVVNNADTNVPQFGPYSDAGAGMYSTSPVTNYDYGNITATTSDGRPPICADFFTDGSGTPAFTPAPAAYATSPAGDQYIPAMGGGTYAHSVEEALGLNSVPLSTYIPVVETQGYEASTGTPFNGYTQGPGYYGKTFFIWPPDPLHDWRKLYFTYPGGNTPMDDNSRLWDSNGNWKAPGNSTYNINYAAILSFIATVGPNPFPPSLRSGRIVYYTAIPSSISIPPADLNQRFWKDYIDYALGVVDSGGGNYQIVTNGQQAETGYGADFASGTVRITAKSQLTGGTNTPYMYYGDNPKRPRLNFWFGPLTMIDMLGNYMLTQDWRYTSPTGSRYSWLPGTCHESPMYACKLGIQSALTDIQSNHPNDYVSLIMFSVPKSSANDTSGARFNAARVGMGQNYSNMIESLWYPPATVGNSSATVTPYDANNLEVPRAFGGTCYAMPLMLAYNQFSAATACSSYAAPAGIAGGNGRKGAQKIVIFETDGAPNFTASAGFVNAGPYQSYYNVRYGAAGGGGEYPTGIGQYGDNNSTVTNQIYTICRQLVALDTASPPGYSGTTRKTLIHCIGFGPQFDPSNPNRSANIATLNQMQTIGNVNDGMPSYKTVYGNQSTIVSSLQQAITQILESTVPVSLIQ